MNQCRHIINEGSNEITIIVLHSFWLTVYVLIFRILRCINLHNKLMLRLSMFAWAAYCNKHFDLHIPPVPECIPEMAGCPRAQLLPTFPWWSHKSLRTPRSFNTPQQFHLARLDLDTIENSQYDILINIVCYSWIRSIWINWTDSRVLSGCHNYGDCLEPGSSLTVTFFLDLAKRKPFIQQN